MKTDLKNLDIGNVSDGYHTFNELYRHRTLLFAVLCNARKDKAWTAAAHDDGTMFDGMFLAGIDTPEGSYTYHCDVEYLKYFDVEHRLNAPPWDGHTPDDIERLFSIIIDF